jgi:hypothetical protein
MAAVSTSPSLNGVGIGGKTVWRFTERNLTQALVFLQEVRRTGD